MDQVGKSLLGDLHRMIPLGLPSNGEVSSWAFKVGNRCAGSPYPVSHSTRSDGLLFVSFLFSCCTFFVQCPFVGSATIPASLQHLQAHPMDVIGFAPADLPKTESMASAGQPPGRVLWCVG